MVIDFLAARRAVNIDAIGRVSDYHNGPPVEDGDGLPSVCRLPVHFAFEHHVSILTKHGRTLCNLVSCHLTNTRRQVYMMLI